MKRLGIVDYLRGYSIFTIIVYHIFQRVPLIDIFQKAINFGGTGVHVFVLCSGFGLYLSHLKKPLSYFSFIKKKALKIYIPYIIIVLISFLVPFMYQNSDRWVALLSHIFLFKMFVEKYVDSFGAQLWFISMIFQFYFIFPFLARFVDKNKPRLTIGLSLLISLLWAVFVCLLGKYELRIWNGFFLQYLWEFSLGMVIAQYYLKKGTFPILSTSILIIGSLVGAIFSALLGMKGGVYKMFNDVPSLFGYLFLSLLIYRYSKNVIGRLFIWVATFSYEWYLVHMLVISICIYFLKDTSLGVFDTLLIGFICSILFALLYKKMLIYIR